MANKSIAPFRGSWRLPSHYNHSYSRLLLLGASFAFGLQLAHIADAARVNGHSQQEPYDTKAQAATSVNLVSSQDPSTFGQSVTFTATVASASGTPGGKVTFKNGSENLGQATLAGGIATFTTTDLSAGTKSITAVYAGNAAFSGSTSSILSQVVDQATSSVDLTSSLNPSVFGQSVIFTAAIVSPSGSPNGRVRFKNGSAILSTVSSAGGVATFTTSTLSAGTKSITAVYAGDAAFSGSTSSILSQGVGQATSALTLTSSQNPSTLGQPVTFTAIVAPEFGGNGMGNIAFKDGNATLGTGPLIGGVATFATSTLSAGQQTITAKFSGGANLSASSATLTQIVTTVVPTYTLAATPLNPASVASGNISTSTITLAPAHGYTGSVDLLCSIISGGSPAPGCSISPSLLTIGGSNGGTATLTVSTSSAVAGSFVISVNGSDANGLNPSNGPQTLTLVTVPTGSPSYTLTATPMNPGFVTSGNTSTSAVTVTPYNGYASTVSLSCAVISDGTPVPTCSLNPSSVAISGSTIGTSTLTAATSTSTLAGNYTITVNGSGAGALAPFNGPQALPLTATSVIQHVVIIFQENRTPDNLFQDSVLISRGADIASSGLNSHGEVIQLSPIDLGTVGPNPQDYDLGHGHGQFLDMYDNGNMDGADLIDCGSYLGAACPPNPQFMYVMPSDVQPYFAMAEQYTFGDRMFQTNEGPSFPAHQFIISGTSAPTATSPLFAAGNPVSIGSAGCLSVAGNTVLMIDATGSSSNFPPEYPCFEHPTLTDLLDAQDVSWRYYSAQPNTIFVGPNAISHICQPQSIYGKLACTGADWTDNMVFPQTQVLTDIANGQLAQVTWVTPNELTSDHAEGNDGSGPSWVASIVNAIGNSPYWADTAIIITWDDWGGWYDHVAPKVINDGVSWGSGYVYGFRVPLIVISPYVKAAYISHSTHDFGSILKFVETNFNLPSLGYADTPADNLSDCFDLTQSPLPFSVIPAPLDAAHFINDKRPSVFPDADD